MRGDGTPRTSRWSTPARSSSSGSGCTSSSQATTTRRSTTAACSARASSWSSTPPPASTPRTAPWSWHPAPRWTTTTSSTRSAAPAPSRHRCPARPNSPIPSPNWSRRSVCALPLDDLHPDAPVTVVGAGLTGIEAATELAEQGRKVTLVCGGQLGPTLSGAGPSIGRQGAGQAGRRRARDRRGDRGPARCGGLRRRRGASERDHRSGRRASACRTWPPPAGCAPTRWAGCSPTRR